MRFAAGTVVPAGRRGAARFGKVEAMSVSQSYQTVTLARGKHTSPRAGACVMELASMLAGEDFSDRPASVCPVIAAFLRAYNDAIDDRRRQDLYRYASAAVGTRASTTVTRARARAVRRGARRVRRWPLAPVSRAARRARVASRDGAARRAPRARAAPLGRGGHARALASSTSWSRRRPGRDDRAPRGGQRIRAVSRGRSSAMSSPREPSRRTRRDAALLEVDPAAGQVVDDLAEVGLVADDQHALVAAGGGEQVERGAPVEALGERLLDDAPSWPNLSDSVTSQHALGPQERSR